MRLAEYTDYTLRVLIYCAAHRDRLVTIAEIADSHAVSKNHLMKIVNDLARQGVLATTRGRGGGMRLLKPASEISLGAVVRATESDFDMVECFNPVLNECRLSSHCHLKGVLGRATQSYLAVLDGVTLADLVPQAAQPPSGAVRKLRLVPGLPSARP